MRILLLDACRNNPFPELNKTAGHGLAIVDAKVGSPGTFVSFSTSPGAEAEDGSGSNSPYTTALLATAKEPGIPIEDTFKRVRLAVNKVTDGRQTPWDSSSLTEDFRFIAGPASAPAQAQGQAQASAAEPKSDAARRSVDDWKRELQGKPIETANELMVADGTDQSYEAFAVLFAGTPRGLQARDWLDRHRRMVAWNTAVLANTAAAYNLFLAQYPDSDLTATARKLVERLRYRPDTRPIAAAVPATNVALAGPTCPCNVAPPPQPKKVDAPAKKRVVEPDPPPRRAAARRPRVVVEDEVVVERRPPPRVVYEPAGPPIGIGIGIGIGGGGFRGGHQGGDGYRGGRY
jgi:hypothetical protein